MPREDTGIPGTDLETLTAGTRSATSTRRSKPKFKSSSEGARSYETISHEGGGRGLTRAGSQAPRPLWPPGPDPSKLCPGHPGPRSWPCPPGLALPAPGAPHMLFSLLEQYPLPSLLVWIMCVFVHMFMQREL